MPNMDSQTILQIAALAVSFLLLPVVMTWALLLPLRGIRKRMDRLISLMESGLPQARPVYEESSQEEKMRRALNNIRGAR
jgi:hypothetical protein